MVRLVTTPIRYTISLLKKIFPTCALLLVIDLSLHSNTTEKKLFFLFFVPSPRFFYFSLSKTCQYKLAWLLLYYKSFIIISHTLLLPSSLIYLLSFTLVLDSPSQMGCAKWEAKKKKKWCTFFICCAVALSTHGGRYEFLRLWKNTNFCVMMLVTVTEMMQVRVSSFDVLVVFFWFFL